MSEEMKVTCLHDKHVALGALMSPFGGFDMPIQYKGIVDEHNAVRNQVGVFDVSHMGEVEITGPEAEKFVNYIFTNDITDAPVGKIFYGMMLYLSLIHILTIESVGQTWALDGHMFHFEGEWGDECAPHAMKYQQYEYRHCRTSHKSLRTTPQPLQARK